MSSVSFITTTPPPTSVTAMKSSTPQTVAADQHQPAVNAGSVTISSDATRRANYEQRMVERSAESNQMRAGNLSGSNLSSPASAKAAYDIAHQDMTNEVGYDISQTLPPGDGILRFTNGEPVTAESKAYQTQQATSYQNQALQLYNSEVAKKTPPGEILNKLLDLQTQQPERYRSMMMWPSAADIANNSAGVVYGDKKSL